MFQLRGGRLLQLCVRSIGCQKGSRAGSSKRVLLFARGWGASVEASSNVGLFLVGSLVEGNEEEEIRSQDCTSREDLSR